MSGQTMPHVGEARIAAFKAQYGWSVRAFLPLAPRGADFFVRMNISANSVTILSLVVFLCGLFIYFIGRENAAARVVAALLFLVGTYLDVVDGYVARLTGKVGQFGAYLDASVDLLRYNAFFAVSYIILPMPLWVVAVGAMYVAFLNISFVRLFYSIGRDRRRMLANEGFGRFFPERYKRFCIENRLLYNPLNLEDQLLFFIFVIGVVFGVEPVVLCVCAGARLAEIAVGAWTRYRH